MEALKRMEKTQNSSVTSLSNDAESLEKLGDE